MSPPVSDERLNALIDGELSPADAAELLNELRSDAGLRDRMAELQLTKAMVRHAYPATGGAGHGCVAAARLPNRNVTRAAVASMALGAVLGWMVNEGIRTQGSATRDPAWAEVATQNHSVRVILHVSKGAAQDGAAALDRAQEILETAHTEGRVASVEIVANGAGLDLLLDGVSPHAHRIAELRANYPGKLTLVACGQTAQRLQDGGRPPRLLPGTIMASSALDRIVQRMQQGWTYIRG